MTIRQIVRVFIEDNFVLFDRSRPLGDQDSLLEAGVIDSTGVLELITFIEDTFGLELVDEDLVPANLDSIQRITDFIAGRIRIPEVA